MTLDEAIERLQESIAETGHDEIDTLTEAEQLGIEALKQVKESRFDPSAFISRLLPGETDQTTIPPEG